MSSDQKFKRWRRAIEIWKDGASVANYLEADINGLRDADGDPLPDMAKQFFIDLLYLRVKPRRGRSLPKGDIREAYQMRLDMLTHLPPPDASERLRGDLLSETVKKQLAEELKTSVATIDQLIYPRQSRKRRKP
jgi:hypothetical protein